MGINVLPIGIITTPSLLSSEEEEHLLESEQSNHIPYINRIIIPTITIRKAIIPIINKSINLGSRLDYKKFRGLSDDVAPYTYSSEETCTNIIHMSKYLNVKRLSYPVVMPVGFWIHRVTSKERMWHTWTGKNTFRSVVSER